MNKVYTASTIQRMNITAAALALAERSLPVFPCAADKKPAWGKKEGGHGFHDASTDAAVVKRLFDHRRAALIGVPTGATSGIDILDIDPRHNGHVWWQRHRHRLPKTWTHHTGGGGLHILFQHVDPVSNTQSAIAEGVDTRGTGGYLIWWPAHGCTAQERAIAPWPAWLLQALTRKTEPPKRAAGQDFPRLDTSEQAQWIAERVLQQLEAATDGTKHITLRKAAYTLGGLLHRLPFGKAEAHQRLYQAVQKAGAIDLENAAKTATWALDKGEAAPLDRRPR